MSEENTNSNDLDISQCWWANSHSSFIYSLGHCGDLNSKHTHGFLRGHPLQAKLSAGELHGQFNLNLMRNRTQS